MREASLEGKLTKWIRKKRRADKSIGLLTKDEEGIPDRIGIWNGKAVAIELKVGNNGLRPKQERFREKWIACGGTYILGRDMNSVEEMLETI